MPTFVFTADDDEICTERNLHNFWKNVTSDQPITFKRYSIRNGSDQSVGHFGYFRSKNTHIWQDILETINKVHHDKSLQTL